MSEIVHIVLAKMRFFAIVGFLSAAALFFLEMAGYSVPELAAEWLIVAAALSASVVLVDGVLAVGRWAWTSISHRTALVERAKEREAARLRDAVLRLRGCSVEALRELDRLLSESRGDPIYMSWSGGPVDELEAHGLVTIVRNGHLRDTGGAVLLLDPVMLANKQQVSNLLAPILTAKP